MIHHVGLCTPVDLNEQTIDFYVAALAPLGYKKAVEFVKTGKVVGLSDGSRTPDFWIMPITHTGDPNLTAGHAHFAFGAKDKKAVYECYAKGIEAGGKDNGAPGPRANKPGYYGAFVTDPAGNNMEIVYMEA